MIITYVQAPGIVYQAICVVGNAIVLVGAIGKGRAESQELCKSGIKKYFLAKVKIYSIHCCKNTFI